RRDAGRALIQTRRLIDLKFIAQFFPAGREALRKNALHTAVLPVTRPGNYGAAVGQGSDNRLDLLAGHVRVNQHIASGESSILVEKTGVDVLETVLAALPDKH